MPDVDLTSAGFAPASDAPTQASPAADLSAAGFAPVPDQYGPTTAPVSDGVFDRLGRVVDTFANAATLGGYNHVVAAGDALLGTGASQAPTFLQQYHENMAAMQRDQDQVPLLPKAAATIAGAVGSPIARGVVAGADAAMAGGKALVNLVPGASRVAAMTPSVVGTVAQGVGEGTALGAAQGAVLGDVPVDERLSNAASGAKLGAELGGVVPVAIGAGRGVADAVQGARAAYTSTGAQGIAKQIIDEAAGGPLTVEQSALPGVPLSLPQASNSRAAGQLASAVSNQVPDPPLIATPKNGVTPEQTEAFRTGLMPISPLLGPGTNLTAVANDSSERLAQGISDAQDALNAHARTMWTTPAMQSVRLDGPSIASGVQQDVAAIRPGLARQLEGGTLGGLVSEIGDLGPNATLDQINAIRSNALAHARNPNTPPAEAAAASQLGGSLLNRIEQGIQNTAGPQPTPGSAATVVPDPPTIGAVPPGFQLTPDEIAAQQPKTPPAPAFTPDQVWSDYVAARDATRQNVQAAGYPEIDAATKGNKYGNVAADPATIGGKFISLATNSPTGVERLNGLTDRLRQVATTSPNPDAATQAGSAADAINSATRDYLASKLIGSAVSNVPDATGAPSLLMNRLQTNIGNAMPLIERSNAFTDAHRETFANAAATAQQLARQANLRPDGNSTTFEKLMANDLIGSHVGAAGQALIGGAAGGYLGYREAPDDASLPTKLGIAGAGALMGAAGGGKATTALGKGLADVPGLKKLVLGPKANVLSSLNAALQDPAVYAGMPNTLSTVRPPINPGPWLIPTNALAGLATQRAIAR